MDEILAYLNDRLRKLQRQRDWQSEHLDELTTEIEKVQRHIAQRQVELSDEEGAD